MLLARLSSSLKNDGALLFDIFFPSTLTEQLLLSNTNLRAEHLFQQEIVRASAATITLMPELSSWVRFARERLVTALHIEAQAGAPTGRLFGQSLVNALVVYLAQRYSTSPPKFGAHRGECSVRASSVS